MDDDDRLFAEEAGPLPEPVDPAADPAVDGRPSVTAFVVARNPGPWFEECLTSFAAQDYPRLAVVVADVASASPLADRVHAVLPGAEVVRLDDDPGGFAAAANAVVLGRSGGALDLICHDDVALAPDAVTELVAEVLRSNAAVLGPKLVHWDDPTRLQHVGQGVDRLAFPAPLAEEGELDQEQYDAVADVFVVPGGCMLIRHDLFVTLGGYDEAIAFRGDDVDLCWRAHLAGARVMVVPRAVGRHRERLGERRTVDDTYRLRLRHALRTLLGGYRVATLVRVLPVAMALGTVELVHAVVTGRFRRARDIVAAWVWNLGRPGSLLRKRRAVAAVRTIDDGELRQLQVRRLVRLRSLIGGRGDADDRLEAMAGTGRELAASLRSARIRNQLALVGIVVLLGIFGTRHLLTRPVPAIGELQPLTGGARALWRDWWSGWHDVGGGVDAPAPTGVGMLGLLGMVFFGRLGLLRTVLTLAPLVIGPVGMWRLIRPFRAPRASLAAVFVYATMPLAYDGLAAGSLTALTAYAVLPFVVLGLARTMEVRPYRAAVAVPGGYRVLTLGLVLAIAAAVSPFLLVTALLIVVGLVVGSLIAGNDRGLVRLVAVAGAAVALALVLHLPWSWSFLQQPRTWAPVGGPGSTDGGPLTFAEILRLDIGPAGLGWFGYAYLVPPALALLIAHEWRLAWAIRGWFVALTGWGVTWAGQRGWLPVPLPNEATTLTLVGLGLALATGCAVVGFREDLRRHRLGWRQLTPFVAGAALLVMILPFARASVDGRWHLPRQGLSTTFEFLDEADSGAGSFRVAWIGDRDVLPLSGATFEGDQVLALTEDRGPRLWDRWAPPLTPVATRTAAVLRSAQAGDTARIGRLLAPLGVRYLVLAEHRAPVGRRDGDRRPVSEDLVRALDGQLDLERIEGVNDAVRIYLNRAWVPVRAAIAPGVDAGMGESPLEVPADLSGTPVLPERLAPARWTGTIPAEGEIALAVPFSPRWQLTVDGRAQPARVAYGYAVAFDAEPGEAVLEYRTPSSRRAALVLQVVAWIAVVAAIQLWRDRATRRGRRRGSRRAVAGAVAPAVAAGPPERIPQPVGVGEAP